VPIPGFLDADVRPILALLNRVNGFKINNELCRFPLADVLWTLAMALDVFLIVFYKYEAEDLRKLELKYITVITALVFIPALTFLFIHTPERGPMYGSVTVSPLYKCQTSKMADT
jgi:hypothetical protein